MRGKDILRHKFPGILIALVVTLVGFISIFGNYSDVYAAADTITVTINKIWADAAPVDSVDFTLRDGNGNPTSVTVSESESWSKTVEVPYSNVYTIAETGFESGDQQWINSVTREIDIDGNYTFNVQNFLFGSIETCDIEIIKVWDDENDAAGKRPNKVTGTLIVPSSSTNPDYTTVFDLNDENNWTEDFTLPDLSRYYINNLQLYEVLVDGYSTNWSMEIAPNDSYCYITITNTLKPESEQTYETINVPNGKEILCDFDILKQSSDNNTWLSGAEFVLQNESGKYATFTKSSDGSYEFFEWVDDESQETKLISGDDGYIHVTKIEAGTYILTETKAPDGYTGLTESVTFTVSSDGITIDTENQDVSVSDDKTTMTVINTTGTELPETGGPGTFTFYMTGMLLTGSAFLLAILRRRRRWVI